MTKQQREIFLLLDRSASMASVHAITVEAVNRFVERQRRLSGEAQFSCREFDHDLETILDRVPLAEVPVMELDDFQPWGGTARHDAICETLDELNDVYTRTPVAQRPGQVIVAILSDGSEDGSRRFTSRDVADRIEHHQDEHGWIFHFLDTEPHLPTLVYPSRFRDGP